MKKKDIPLLTFKIKHLIWIFIFLKLLTFLLIGISSFLIPFNEVSFDANFTYPENQKINFLTSFVTWDSQHYLAIAKVGYGEYVLSSAFYPLYPFLMYIASLLIQNVAIAGFIVSTVLSFFAVIYFYKFITRIASQNVAFISLLLFLLFPTSFYIHLIYTEALFLFLLSALLYYLYSRNFLLASLFLFLLPFSRTQGILLVFPLFVYILFDKQKKATSFAISTFNEKLTAKFYKEYVLIIVPMLGYVGYLLVMYVLTGDPFASYNAQKYFIGQYNVLNIFNPVLFFYNLFEPIKNIHLYTNSIIDRLFFVLYLANLPLVYKKTDKALFTLYVLMGITPFLGSFMAYTRYLLLALPLFITWGKIINERQWIIPAIIISLFLFSLQVLFIILYALNYWVS